MNEKYISKTLIEILDALNGTWSIKYYELVHHGWLCTIQNLDSFPFKPATEFFLHSEEGYIEIRENRNLNSKLFAKNINVPSEVATIIELSIT